MALFPVPKIYAHTKEYWEGAKQGKLILPYCAHCEKFFFYPRVICPECYKNDILHKEMERKGTIETYSIVHHAPFEVFSKQVPYALGMIRLKEDVLIFMGIKGDIEKIKMGAEGDVVFEKREDFFIPFFQVEFS